MIMNLKKIELLKSLISDLEKRTNQLRNEIINEYGESLQLISKFMLASFSESEIRKYARLIGKENELPVNCVPLMIANLTTILFLEAKNGIDVLFSHLIDDRPRKRNEIFILEKTVREILNR